ncbi:MAG: phosphoribosylanthranilate isomerase [Xanthomonadales bacterium]|nr:phosphoribosylanthranilate isomerase [Xanthomonadales bacterium]
MTRVKICCMTTPEEVAMASEQGAYALGLVSAMPTGEGVISDEKVAELSALVPPGIRKFLLTSKTDAEGIAQQVKDAQTDTVQLVDRMSEDTLKRLRELLPETKLVQVVHVTGRDSIEEAVSMAVLADEILLDSGQPDAEQRSLGGTGNTHNWDYSAEIVRSLDKPVFLAGGLHPGNVTEAIRHVRPFGVDVCSRLRPNARLDPALLRDFFQAVAAA